MAFKYLKNKDKVLESWFNPVLSGGTNQGSNILPPGSFASGSPFAIEPGGNGQVTQPPCSDWIEKPAWLDNNDDSLVRNGDTLSIGAFYLNGVPLTSWSANFGGQGGYQQRQTMKNFHYLDTLTKQLFPSGIKAFLGQDDTENLKISNLYIIRLVPHSNAIGLNAYIRFNLNDTEIWAKFENIGVDAKPKFVCGDINMEQLSIETRIKTIGKLWNTISQWFQAKTGIYKCLAKEVLIYSELGQLKRITEGNVIEVLHADENKIKIKYDDTTYFVKRPTYYWFNWYFQKH
jgi:hypothetical protein